MSATFISVDWGTTSFRAYRVAADGAVIDARESASGILAITDGAFAATLRDAIAPWLAQEPGLVIVMSGMIGSRQGWVEAPYLGCPASVEAIAAGLVAVDGEGLPPIRLVPGLSTRAHDGRPDVLRGEETQVLGAMRRLGSGDGLFVLPGTHAKWVSVAGGTITGFETYMTGEVFAALKDHTILGRMMEGASTGDGGAQFGRGVRLGAEAGHPGHLLNRIFSARTLALMGELPTSETAAYLSGLLIGAELAAATSRGARRFTIIAGAALAERYLAAAEALGLEAAVAPADCVAAGHRALLDCKARTGGDR